MNRTVANAVVAMCLVLAFGATVPACSWYMGGTDPCAALEEKMVAEILQSYSGTGSAPNLLEPLALAVAPKKVRRLVGEKSHFGCVLTLYHLNSNPEAIKQLIQEGGE